MNCGVLETLDPGKERLAHPELSMAEISVLMIGTAVRFLKKNMHFVVSSCVFLTR